jgi:5,10-methylenetetrahydrofolate reductase
MRSIVWSLTTLLDALSAPASVIAAELRPPRAELGAAAGMDAWIDTYHAVKGLVRGGTFVFITDSAVGLREEDNLRHLTTNLGSDVPRSRVVPFLTTKHTVEYCLAYADRAVQQGFPSLVVLGGDKAVGIPRCVGHAWELRKAIRDRQPDLRLGGWANPHAEPGRQVEYLLDRDANADFYLTQIVSHHDAPAVERFVREGERQRLTQPGVFGVFYYRSANPRTLEALKGFLPVPAEALTREFGEGASAVDICARTLSTLASAGARHFYISNLPAGRALSTLSAILERAKLPSAPEKPTR